MTAVATTQPQTGSGAWRATLPHVLPFVGILLAAVLWKAIGLTDVVAAYSAWQAASGRTGA